MENLEIYYKFKTVMEMVYVIEKANNSHWSKEQMQHFEHNFVENLLTCLQNKKFQKDYALYEEAMAQKHVIIPPEKAYQGKLNRILTEIENIKLSCQSYRLDNKEIWRKQADTRLKYEKRLRNKELYAKFLASTKNEK